MSTILELITAFVISILGISEVQETQPTTVLPIIECQVEMQINSPAIDNNDFVIVAKNKQQLVDVYTGIPSSHISNTINR